jgi:hypothetical protein
VTTHSGNGPLVVELLTRAHRLGFVLEYRPRAPEARDRIHVASRPDCTHPDDRAHRQLEGDIHDLHEDLLAVWARTCTVLLCDEPTHLREYGTDLPWCRGHAIARGCRLLIEEYPDVFSEPLNLTAHPNLTQEDNPHAA